MTRKANGQGHTYKVGNSYRTVIRSGSHRVTAMAPTAPLSRSKAREKLVALHKSLSSGDALMSGKVKLSEYLLPWLETQHRYSIVHSTYRRYLALATYHILPSLGHLELRQIIAPHITTLFSEMRAKGQSPRSQQQARALLAVAFRDAEAQGIISNNPISKVRNPTLDQSRIEPLNKKEVLRLLDAYAKTFMAARLHIALICGLRQGEALGLLWDDIDLDHRILSVRQQAQIVEGKQVFAPLKTSRSRRDVVLTEETIDTLRQHQKILAQMAVRAGEDWAKRGLVFPNATGGFLHPTKDYNEWQRALKLCGIPPRRLHDARHTSATLMYSQGVGIETISRTLGHSTSAITSKLYVHSTLEPQRSAAELLNSLLIGEK